MSGTKINGYTTIERHNDVVFDLKYKITKQDKLIKNLADKVKRENKIAGDNLQVIFKQDKLIRELVEGLRFMETQENLGYGMPEGEAVKFRMRRVFSYIDEILSSPELVEYLKEK